MKKTGRYFLILAIALTSPCVFAGLPKVKEYKKIVLFVMGPKYHEAGRSGNKDEDRIFVYPGGSINKAYDAIFAKLEAGGLKLAQTGEIEASAPKDTKDDANDKKMAEMQKMQEAQMANMPPQVREMMMKQRAAMPSMGKVPGADKGPGEEDKIWEHDQAIKQLMAGFGGAGAVFAKPTRSFTNEDASPARPDKAFLDRLEKVGADTYLLVELEPGGCSKGGGNFSYKITYSIYDKTGKRQYMSDGRSENIKCKGTVGGLMEAMTNAAPAVAAKLAKELEL